MYMNLKNFLWESHGTMCWSILMLTNAQKCLKEITPFLILLGACVHECCILYTHVYLLFLLSYNACMSSMDTCLEYNVSYWWINIEVSLLISTHVCVRRLTEAIYILTNLNRRVRWQWSNRPSSSHNFNMSHFFSSGILEWILNFILSFL